MQLEIRLIKEFDNEANMRASRDSVLDKAQHAGYITLWTVKE